MLLGLRTAIYPVSDLAAAKAWYTAVAEREPYFDQPLWGVTNAHAACERLLALGGKLLDPVQDVGDGIKVGAVLDPFGNRLGFIENPLDAMARAEVKTA